MSQSQASKDGQNIVSFLLEPRDGGERWKDVRVDGLQEHGNQASALLESQQKVYWYSTLGKSGEAPQVTLGEAEIRKVGVQGRVWVDARHTLAL